MSVGMVGCVTDVVVGVAVVGVGFVAWVKGRWHERSES